METTLQLLEKALATGKSQRALSRDLGLADTALGAAKHRGSLSPVAAGQLAAMLGEPVDHWIAIAVIESEPKSRVTEQLRKALRSVRNS